MINRLTGLSAGGGEIGQSLFIRAGDAGVAAAWAAQAAPASLTSAQRILNQPPKRGISP